MNKWLIIGLVVIAGIIIINNTCILGNCVEDTTHHDFAQYLTSEGIAMAGTDWCHYCKNQKEMFGDSFQYIDYKNCDNERSWCLDHGVQGYPTWVFPDGEIYPGVRTIAELKDLSGYDG